MLETNSVIRNVIKEINLYRDEGELIPFSRIQTMILFEFFFPQSIMEKLNINLVLKMKKRMLTTCTVIKLKQVMVTHVLVAMYQSAKKAIKAP